MVACDLCGKTLKNTQGLRGHKTFQHGEFVRGTQYSVTRVPIIRRISMAATDPQPSSTGAANVKQINATTSDIQRSLTTRVATEAQLSAIEMWISSTQEQLEQLESTVERQTGEIEHAIELTGKSLSRIEEVAPHSHKELREIHELESSVNQISSRLKSIEDHLHGKLHLCPFCGRQLHMRMSQDQSWFLQCVHCGSHSLTYKPPPCSLNEFRLEG